MKKLNFITAVILSLSAINVSANISLEKNNETTNSKVVKNENYINANFLNNFILLDEKQKKEYLKKITKEKGNNVLLKRDNDRYIIPLTSFLLIQNFENEASFLIDNNIIEPFQFFTINDKKQSDLSIAIQNNNLDYFKSAVKKMNNVNQQYDINNKKGITLLMETAILNKEYIYPFTKTLLDKGANENLQSLEGFSAYDIAKNNSNEAFLNALSDYNSAQTIDNKQGYLKNNKLSADSQVEQELMIENLNSGLLDELEEKNELYKALHSMIIFGFNDAADIILDRIESTGKFNPNKTNENGVSLVMASAMSDLTNGNVEYLTKLIDKGAEYKKPINGITPIQIAIKRDNVKVVVALIEKGVSIFENENNKVDLFTFAVNVEPLPQKTIKFLLSFVESLKSKAEEIKANNQ